MAFIRYQQKTSGLYASVYNRRKVNGKRLTTIENLGRVLDKDKGIFISRERGPFVFFLGQEAQPVEDVYGYEETNKLGLFAPKEHTRLRRCVYPSRIPANGRSSIARRNRLPSARQLYLCVAIFQSAHKLGQLPRRNVA
jgi:hypothetical protein